MKLEKARLTAFLATPDPKVRAVLVYGPDQGQAKERAERIVAAIVPDRDAFRIATLTGTGLAADPALLEDEARALSLVPGRRVVRVREAGDA
ncbi:MAG: DNA polymerase III subunit delta, partial [Stellaceae bacterium]